MAKYNITEKKEKTAVYRSLINPQLMDELKGKILDTILVGKKYKDKNYSAKQLAADLGTNTRYISAVVNVPLFNVPWRLPCIVCRHSNFGCVSSAFISCKKSRRFAGTKRFDNMR